MRALNMTLRHLAYLTGIRYKNLNEDMYREFSVPMFEKSLRIAAALRCPVDDLIPKSPVSEKAPVRVTSITRTTSGKIFPRGRCRRSYAYHMRRVREEQERARAKKIRTRAEMVREKACSVQKKASAA
jgi:hypothetical protein